MIVDVNHGVTLLGAGEVMPGALSEALTRAPILVAADGGARLAVEAGHLPEAVIGDMDSLDPATRERIPRDRLYHVAEQDSTDFEKCLSRIRAPFVLGAGFMGGRLDHELAALNVLVRHPGQRCILIGPVDICLHVPPALDLPLTPGTRVSLFPMTKVRATGEGLRWPVDRVPFDPAGAIGTSNEALGPVEFTADRPSLLAILPASALRAAVAALAGSERWP